MGLFMGESTKLKFKEKEYIARCINRAKNKNNKFFREKDFELEAGKGHLLWNYIYSNLKYTFRSNNKFSVGYIQNHAWKQIYMYNKFEKELYLILSESTFTRIMKQKKEQHLIAALANVNDGDLERINHKYRAELLKLEEIPKRSTIIVFDYDASFKKGTYKSIMITPNLLEVESEEWMINKG